MKKLISFLVLPFIVVLTFGCSATQLTSEAKSVKIAKADPPDNCEDLGPVDATGMKLGGVSADEQTNRLRARTAEKGGNYFRLETISANGFKGGTAFKCP